MPDAVQKLTVKMPWTRNLSRAEVETLHVSPGTRVRENDPIVTLISEDGKHVIRAAHGGRLVPLVSPGDSLTGGDPLYVLRRDEARAPVRRTPRGQEGAPGLEPSRRFAGLQAISDQFGHWGWFIAAIGAYALGARLLIPRLQKLLGDEGPEAWIWFTAASIGAGILIFGVLAQLGRDWPKRMTWGLAACWAGLSVVALTDVGDRVKVPDSLRDFGEQTLALLSPDADPAGEPELALAPDPAPPEPAPPVTEDPSPGIPEPAAEDLTADPELPSVVETPDISSEDPGSIILASADPLIDRSETLLRREEVFVGAALGRVRQPGPVPDPPEASAPGTRADPIGNCLTHCLSLARVGGLVTVPRLFSGRAEISSRPRPCVSPLWMMRGFPIRLPRLGPRPRRLCPERCHRLNLRKGRGLPPSPTCRRGHTRRMRRPCWPRRSPQSQRAAMS